MHAFPPSWCFYLYFYYSKKIPDKNVNIVNFLLFLGKWLSFFSAFWLMGKK